ncbi:MAG: hypothetical protein ACPGVK_02640, partial [Halocynthiibacter sp.]
MTPNFALNLSHTGIELLSRSADGWRSVGATDLSAPDLAEKMQALIWDANKLHSELTVMVSIPESEVLFTSMTVAHPEFEGQYYEIYEGLHGLTPYPPSDVRFDWWPNGDRMQLAVVALETLQEAEGFVLGHGFKLASFVAQVGDGMAFFGPSITRPLDVEREALFPVSVGPAEYPTPVIDPVPAPPTTVVPSVETVQTPAEAADAPVEKKNEDVDATLEPRTYSDEPSTNPAHEPVSHAVDDQDAADKTDLPAKEKTKPVPPAEEKPKSHATPPIPTPVKDEAVAATPAFVSLRTKGEDTPDVVPNTGSMVGDMRPRIGFGLLDTTAKAPDEKTPKADTSKSKTTKAKADSPKKAQKASKSAAKFTAADDPKSDDKPIRASAALERLKKPQFGVPIKMRGADGAVTAIGRRDIYKARFAKAKLAARASAASLMVAAERAKSSPHVARAAALPRIVWGILLLLLFVVLLVAWIRGDSDELTQAEASFEELDVINEPQSVEEIASGLEEEAPEAPSEYDVEIATQISVDEAIDLYDKTGIWQRASDAYTPEGFTDVADMTWASIDPDAVDFDALALPEFDAGYYAPLGRQRLPQIGEPAAAPDENGIVVATKYGVLTPEGVKVFAGNPVKTPRRRVDVLGEDRILDPALLRLKSKRPKRRPSDLVEDVERAVQGGITTAELGRIRPKRRPPSAQKPIEPEQPIVVAEPRKVKTIRPQRRPADFAKRVARLKASSKKSTSVAAVPASQSVSPRIPSRSSVAKAATQKNVFALNKVSLIGVYGTPKKRHARVRLKSGRFVKVRVGDRVDGGKVAAIGRS